MENKKYKSKVDYGNMAALGNPGVYNAIFEI